MYWTIILLSILSPILFLATLVVVDRRNMQPVRASGQPKPVGSDGQAGRPIHSGRHRRVRPVFSMF